MASGRNRPAGDVIDGHPAPVPSSRGVHLHWYLPTNGDSHEIVGSGDGSRAAAAGGFRAPTISYLSEVARAADELGFEAVLTPTGTWCEDAWITTAALTQSTTRLRFLVAFRPGLVSPTLAAHQAATFQRVSGGRLLLNAVAGGDSVEQRRLGDHLDHDRRYERADEFLTILRGVADAPVPFDFTGAHYRIEQARIEFAPWGPPPVFFGGASPAAERVAARHADTYLVWGEAPGAVAERIDRVRALAREYGREPSFGIRFHVISRETADEAWAETDRLLSSIDDAGIERARRQIAASESEAQRRQAALHGHDRGRLVIHPNVWAGYGLVRAGVGTAIVGSHEEVADRIAEYHSLGIDHFILSGQPHLEEAWRFGEGAAAVLRRRGLLSAAVAGEAA